VGRRLGVRIKRDQKIAGRPVHEVREFLRRNPFGFGPRNISKHFGADITDDLVVAGLIERDKNSYRTTAAGDRLAIAKFIPSIDRAKANRIVAEFLQRVDAINANDKLLMRVRRVRAFGSFITSKPDLGDIDLAIELERKEMPGEEWVALSRARAEATGHQVRDSDRDWYGEIEVRRMLKNRNPYLSFHNFDELARLGCKSKRIYSSVQKRRR
jgi:hypothetical protein